MMYYRGVLGRCSWPQQENEHRKMTRAMVTCKAIEDVQPRHFVSGSLLNGETGDAG